jgi:hypothetical protein
MACAAQARAPGMQLAGGHPRLRSPGTPERPARRLRCAAGHSGPGNSGARPSVIESVKAHSDTSGDARPANLVLVEQSGAKHEIPQSSPGDGMAEAEQVMHDPGLHLREVKVVSEHKAIARWKASELGWRRVA